MTEETLVGWAKRYPRTLLFLVAMSALNVALNIVQLVLHG